MPVEIEAKLKVEDLEPVRAALRDGGAAPLGRFLEINIFFDTEDRSLLAADQGLRLRINRDIERGRTEHVLTHKGRRMEGPLKRREETELAVAGADGAMALLDRLGYRPVLSFQKKRQSWKLNACRVELDEVPLLGTFVEIEGPDEATILKARQRIGLSNRAIVKASYIALLTAYLQERGESMREITFPAEE